MTSVRKARSSNWRVNTSSIKAVEGAYILAALRKVAGVAGLPAGFKVRFVTKENIIDPDNEDVKIEAGDLFSKAPIPAENLDVLVGRTLHEVEHHSINTVGVWLSCQHKAPNAEREIFHRFVHLGEDILIGHKLAANQHLRDYYDAAMDHLLHGRRKPRLNDLMELWIEFALAGNRDILAEVSAELDDGIQELIALTERINIPTERLSGTRIRADYYADSWEKIKSLVLYPPEIADEEPDSDGALPQPSMPGEQEDNTTKTRPGPNQQPDAEARQNEDYVKPMNSHLSPIDQKLADEIEDALESGTEDITEKIYSEFDDAGFLPSGMTFLITRKYETKAPPILPDPDQCRRLERILNIRRRLQSRVMRGEIYGKLDMRKLFRSQTDQRMFKLKYRFPDGFPETAILVDMSGSMSGKQAEEVITAATSLAHVVQCRVWSYAETGSEIELVKLNDGKITHKTNPNGNTPSGIALVGVADTMKKGGLIIHLTDGEHNVEFGPAEATQVLDKKGVQAVHLLWAYNEVPYEGLQYKILSEGISEFPEALYQILIEQLNLEGLAR